MHLSHKVRTNAVPRHVAIVMDGNGRWAKKRMLPRLAGHRQGVEALRKAVYHAAECGIEVLTVFAFSSENWNRPPEEVSGLMSILVKSLQSEAQKLNQAGVRLYFPGNRQPLSDQVKDALTKVEALTSGNHRLVLNICFNYGGRWDIVQAVQMLVARGEPITEQSLSACLSLSHSPDPDLLIRTGGEVRISNFLLWQSAYSELYFSDKLWPEFDELEFDCALSDYAGRERRFGRTSEQVQS